MHHVLIWDACFTTTTTLKAHAFCLSRMPTQYVHSTCALCTRKSTSQSCTAANALATCAAASLFLLKGRYMLQVPVQAATLPAIHVSHKVAGGHEASNSLPTTRAGNGEHRRFYQITTGPAVTAAFITFATLKGHAANALF
jgi:hypothetical protein